MKVSDPIDVSLSFFQVSDLDLFLGCFYSVLFLDGVESLLFVLVNQIVSFDVARVKNTRNHLSVQFYCLIVGVQKGFLNMTQLLRELWDIVKNILSNSGFLSL